MEQSPTYSLRWQKYREEEVMDTPKLEREAMAWWERYCQADKQITQLKLENLHLLADFNKYGGHTAACDLHRARCTRCDCGYDESKERWE